MRTDRLLLRGWRESDRAPYASLNADTEVMRHFPSTLTNEQSDEMVDRIIAAWSARGFGLWAVEREDSGEFIGFVGLAAPSWHADFTPCVEVGWRLTRSQWGNGFAPEAAHAALAFGFEHVELPNDEIVSFTTRQNVKSQRVMHKIGLRPDPSREFDHPLTPGWAEQRHVFYAIERARWTADVAR
ncbi:MAG: GNAT family N-acetyltransferase [Actinomycetia bacterium]|nr:GNAT family N-acetyltransferase [Actinomycetes bacterium]